MVDIILIARDYNVNKGWKVNIASYLVMEKKIVVHLPEVWRMSKKLNLDFTDVFTKIVTHEVLHHVIMGEIPEKYIKMMDGQETIAEKLSGTDELLWKYKAELVAGLLNNLRDAKRFLYPLLIFACGFVLGVFLSLLVNFFT